MNRATSGMGLTVLLVVTTLGAPALLGCSVTVKAGGRADTNANSASAGGRADTNANSESAVAPPAAGTAPAVATKTCPDLDPKTTVTYTFNSLNDGELKGQDGWSLVGGNSPMTIKAGAGPDGSKAPVFLNFGQLVRKNDATFSFPRLSGTETTLAIEYDTLYAGSVQGATSEFMLVATSTMTEGLTKTSTSPWIGLKSGQINYREASFGEQIAAPVPSDVKPGSWIRLRLVIDLTDKSDGKSGSASAFLKDLSAKGGLFRAVSGLQGLDARLNRAVSGPSSWDGVYIRFDKPADYRTDNLSVSPASNCK